MTDPKRIVDAAREWVGTPYVHQARGPKGSGGGTDCVGLLIGVGIELGIMPPDYDPTGYAWVTDGTQLRKELSRWADLIAFSESPREAGFWYQALEPGDIAVFKVVGHPQHTAFISSLDYGLSGSTPGMIHAYNPSKKVVEHNLSERWLNRLTEVWRLR